MSSIRGRSVRVVSLAFLFCVLFLILPEEAFARAGGGRSKGGGAITILCLPFILIYTFILYKNIKQKVGEAKDMIESITELDALWGQDALKKRVQDTYFVVQFAWRDMDYSKAREYLTDTIYRKHMLQVREMEVAGNRNVMEQIGLDAVQIVEVQDFKNDAKDEFTAVINGYMVDYLIDERTKKIVDGDRKKRSFKELWRFKREGNDWKLDEIRDVSIGAIKFMESFSEELESLPHSS